MATALPYQDTLMIYYAIAAVALPLLAFVINSSIPGKQSKVAGWLSTLAILMSCVLAVTLFARIWNGSPVHGQLLWFTVGSTALYAGIMLNNLSVLMLLLVTVIALPVHIYSTAYMKGDERYNRYFAYLSLFCFSMLALVVVDNLLLLYAFWELVGFSSYLLIGFWFTQDAVVQANKKAFIMNRIGDIGLLTGILILFAHYQTFDIVKLFSAKGLIFQSTVQNGHWTGLLGNMAAKWQYIAVGGIFMGVAAKSAQFPLHTWLPDAMGGPTAVSALIHAATMVASGVFLLARFYPLFTTGELDVLAVLGCFTAFMTATIALTQNDLKRVLAFSTISQLGFMVMAMGIGAYASSLLHLITHAFFKCMLFLCAGIIIHQMQHIKDEYDLDINPQNILYMGGLAKKMPVTFTAFIIGSLALIGIPFTSGYLSKDGILIQAFSWAEGKTWWHILIPIGALLSGVLTAFYVARLVFKVFFGDFQLQKIKTDITLHISDGGWQYRVPLILLSVCCLFPLFSFNPFVYEDAWIFKGMAPADYFERMNIYHTIVPVGINILSIFVIYWAYAVYVQQRSVLFSQNNFLFRLSHNEWYIDVFYNRIIVKGVLIFSNALYWFDKNVIDGFVNLLEKVTLLLAKITDWTDRNIVDGFINSLATVVTAISNFVRGFQGGKVQYYLLSMLALVLALFIYKILI